MRDSRVPTPLAKPDAPASAQTATRTSTVNAVMISESCSPRSSCVRTRAPSSGRDSTSHGPLSLDTQMAPNAPSVSSAVGQRLR